MADTREIVKRICPKCNTRLKITRTEGMKKMDVPCPVCGNTFTVFFDVPPPPMQGVQPSPAPQPYGAGGGTHTQIITTNDRAILKCTLTCNGQVYPLVPGRNVVGRMSPTSAADIQIPTQDRNMSRRHASIFVKPNKVTIQKFGDNAQSLLVVDGMPLQVGDEVKVLPGSIIVMGRTQMVCSIM